MVGNSTSPQSTIFLLATVVHNLKPLSQKKVLAIAATKSHLLHLWHQRLGHLNNSSVRKLSNMLNNIKILETDQDNNHLCIACLEGKASRTYNKEPSPRASRPLELLHSDLCGPFERLSIA